MSDPRPADLTAQGPVADRECPACGWITRPCECVQVASCFHRAPRLAAPSRGQGAGPCRCGGTKVVTCFVDADVIGLTPCHACSPAPVASPERKDGCFACGCAACDGGCGNNGHLCTPAGPETGWLAENELPRPTTLEQAIAERNGWANTACQNQINADYWRDRCAAAESTLSAATERAEGAERATLSMRDERDHWLDRVHYQQDRALRAEEQLAAALKLAGEAFSLIGRSTGDDGLEWTEKVVALEARLASLSSPSAPESGTQGEASQTKPTNQGES